MKEFEELTSKSIFWQKHPTNNKYFYAINDSNVLLLRLNNFPDEVLLTLINRLDILDMEEVPPNWIVPFDSVSTS